MRFLAYEEVPPQITQKIIEEVARRQQEEARK
jgi:hypothetical protein